MSPVREYIGPINVTGANLGATEAEQNSPKPGPFAAVLAEMQALHDKKGADYGKVVDPFANVRASQEFGIPPWLGAILRGNDKVARIKSFATKGRLQNESLRDSLIDLAVYAAIAVALYDEETKSREPNAAN